MGLNLEINQQNITFFLTNNFLLSKLSNPDLLQKLAINNAQYYYNLCPDLVCALLCMCWATPQIQIYNPVDPLVGLCSIKLQLLFNPFFSSPQLRKTPI